MTIPSELSEQFARGDIAVFVGAGLSIGAKLPSWIKLMQPLAKAVAYRLPDEDALITAEALLEVAQLYENKYGLNALISHLRTQLDTHRQPTIVHRLLARFQLDHIFTTNYDDLLERAFEKAGKPVHAVVSDIDLPFWSEARVQVVKLCGSLDRPDSIMVTRDQFQKYTDKREALARRLHTSLEGRTALFLGYKLKDPFFNQIWDNIGLDFGALRRPGYAVMFGEDRKIVDDLKRRNITVINLRAQEREITSRLAQWLSDLQNALIRKHGGMGLTQKSGKQPLPGPGQSPAPRRSKELGRGIPISLMINGKKYQGNTLPALYGAVLQVLVEEGHLANLEMPLATSSTRYLISTVPVHPKGAPFFRAVSYGGYHMEANKSREGGLTDLKWLIKRCGLSGKARL
jgi:hypothetical protein